MATLRTAPMALGMALALSGCTYVTPDAYEEKLACLDEDGDGAVRRGDCPLVDAGEALVDCDDTRADRFPGNEEIPYDGIDQNCDGEDIIDADGDGYPGVAEAEWTADHSNLEWPSSLQAQVDCDDSDDTVYPDSPFAVPYDGVNSACIDDPDWDDWDADNDGFVPRPGTFNGEPYTGDLPQTDCDDDRADVYPDAPEPHESDPDWDSVDDKPYDGIDRDCDGSNDYDWDGDGYIRDADIGAYQTFLARYQYTDDRPCTASDGSCDDCVDDPNVVQSGIPADQIHPDMPETWYDGVDQNCDGANDYDRDADGFECDGSVDSACSGHPGTDCVDTNGAIKPNALELLGDGVDQDCADGADGARLLTGSYSWTAPGLPSVTAIDGHYLLGVSAEERITNTGTLDDTISLLLFPALTATPESAPTARTEAPPFTLLGPSVVLRGFGGSYYLATSTSSSTNVYLQHALYYPVGSNWIPGTDASSSTQIASVSPPASCLDDASNSVVCPYDHVDARLAIDDSLWIVGCNDEVVHVSRCALEGSTSSPLFTCSTGSTTVAVGHVAVADSAAFCMVDEISGDDAVARIYDGVGGYTEYDVTMSPSPALTAATAPTHLTDSWGIANVRTHPDFVVYAGGPDSTTTPTGVNLVDNGVAQSVAALDGVTVFDADAIKVDDNWYVVAVTDEAGERVVTFLYGTDLASLTATTLTVPDDAQPIGASIHADAERVFVGITAEGTASDVVAWALWGFAP